MKKVFTKNELLSLGLPESAVKDVVYDGCSVSIYTRLCLVMRGNIIKQTTKVRDRV